MPTNKIDCTGLTCPQPLVMTKQVIEKNAPQSLEITVDNQASLENVVRFLNKNGYATSHTSKDGIWTITAKASSAAANSTGPAETANSSCASLSEQRVVPEKTLVLIISPFVGTGDDELGGRLMKNFLGTLPEMGEDLWRIVLLNGGVTLAAQNSPVIAELKALEAAGVSILVCGSCLEHFKLLQQKAVGETTNMLDVVTSLQLADKVIRI